MTFRVGVDIGGTFIDFCFFNEKTKELSTLKVLTTPDNPGSEVMTGLKLAHERMEIAPETISHFIHGTTVGVNTVIMGNGAKLALFTTAAFEDVLELARLRMPETYSLMSFRADPLVGRDAVFPISERIRSDGSIARPLDRASVQAAVRGAREKDVAGIIISLINSYRNPEHEREVKRIVQELAPDLFVFTSTEIWPVIREYERTTTAAINGYVHPKVEHYITRLQGALKKLGVLGEPLITKSNGGVMTAELGKANCVSMLLSGTASGVMGAAFLARNAGIDHVLTIDIGGTSADVAVINHGEPHYATGEKVGQHTLHVPAVAVSSIGEGGGSIAWVDDFGVLKVGPESAGSTPGPACYGRGGTRATITDAFAVCGLIGQESIAYGAISINPELARKAVSEIADKLGWTVELTAKTIIDVALSGMYLEINKLVARHGIDIRDFTLLAFGGAGPMLAPMLARELGIPRVMIPLSPGVVSALGGLVADIRNDFIASLYLPLTEETLPKMAEGFATLQQDANTWLRNEQKFEGPANYLLSADMRYAGQSFEIEVPLDSEWIANNNVEAIRDAFHAAHERLYAYRDIEAEVHIVNLRTVVTASGPKPELAIAPLVEGSAQPTREAAVVFDGTPTTAGLYLRDDLKPGQTFVGPAIVLQSDTTSCIPAGFKAQVDAWGNIQLTATEA
ncbi:hydantoinase/oxoprolinase family protein [Microvirga pakistanensis]|uniref:hydantoinase/oxoprolinase family protein n=1 Tax=Microvirga pakistanensis TaxID=1682650 RepID=UPI00106B1AEE|nr:hydantoinase/oxoprolinase family protein [Microvirga pakistanensis]